jgi:predicted small integral membrane protein
MAWMAWTLPTAIFFIVIAALLVGMTVWQLASPSVPRRGFLPMATTRGDRLFIGLLGMAFINLAILAATEWSSWGAVVVSAGAGLVWLVIVMRWG